MAQSYHGGDTFAAILNHSWCPISLLFTQFAKISGHVSCSRLWTGTHPVPVWVEAGTGGVN